MSLASLSSDGLVVSLTAANKTTRFHAIWLRDNALDDATKSSSNGQRLIALRDIDVTTYISHARVTADALQVTFVPEHKTVSFPLAWLAAHAYDKPQASTKGWLPASQSLWNNNLMGQLPEADFDAVSNSPLALQAWL
ncbi:MAG: gamma-butyrobetaine hydroxylase-like domain-containing protein, partial [Oceanospirillaceae bacterium]|nr:gamma-butyrobetaine hydroxylase-like domain-containing protein [Oceanospirillaceae bacterium]